MIGTHHACELTGGEYDVDIRIAAGITQWFESGFFFFGEAWHNGDHADFMRIDVYAVSKVAFGDGSEHFHW